MKKIIIFIGLKIAEIIGVCGIAGIIYGIGIVMTDILKWLPLTKDESHFWRFASGFLGLGLLVLIWFVYYGIHHAIKANWDWADRIASKK